MLFTRCPDCETTFRITADALRKADGQVRCGRCACVFNAYRELRRRARKTAAAPSEHAETAPHRDAPTPSAATSAAKFAAPGDTLSAAGTESAAPGSRTSEPVPAGTADATDASPAARSRPAAPVGQALPGVIHRLRGASPAPAASDTEKDVVVGDISLAGVIAELAASAAPDDADAVEAAEPAAPDRKAGSIELLEKNGLPVPAAPARRSPGRKADTAGGGTDEPAAPAWVILDEAPARKRVGQRVWTGGALAAAVLLALQVLHHYRDQLAVLEVVGPGVREAYAMLGAELVPDWNLDQYELVVDWDAVTPETTDAQDGFKIAARIRNKGPGELPLPHVRVELKDRWESTLGSRIFAPAEYLPRGAVVHRSMIAGQIALAELAIEDPGPQAYGFELDVCVAAQAGALRCAADEVFR